ncbi:MAG TPA: carboxypeptidase regulatory-like domain-containing protein, partial [Candidatus Polarisedimenticolaceae bacterium]|nr:carboxypeptidase regulatory-like domain-containing protein [Candidatus Polarisedimenticolaceae bacterium]
MKLSRWSIWLVVVWSTTAAADGITVGGRVRVPGGLPLARADVQLLVLAGSTADSRALFLGGPAEPVARVLSDEEGRFRIEAPHAGLWRVRVEAPGFVAMEHALEPLIEQLELPEVTLPADTGLKVSVRGPGGSPIAGAFVLAGPEHGPFATGGRSGWSAPLRGGTTGAAGTVELPRGEGERIGVTASAAGHALAERRAISGTAVTLELLQAAGRPVVVQAPDGSPIAAVLVVAGARHHPVAVTDEQGRAAVAVAGDGMIDARFVAEDGRQSGTRIGGPPAADGKPRVVEIPPATLVAGRVIDAESRRSITGAVVYDAGTPTIAAVTDRAGSFVLRAARSTRLTLTAGAPGYLAPDRPAEATLADDGRPGPTIALRPAAAIEGRVTAAAAGPLAGVEVTIEEQQAQGTMRFEFGAPSAPPRASTDVEGRYRLGRVDPSKNWTVRARADGFAPAEVRAAGLEPRELRTNVDLELRRGLSLIGSVTTLDSVPLADVEVTIEPSSSAARDGMLGIRRETAPSRVVVATDGDGRFRADGLPAGKVDVTARRNGFAPGELRSVEIVAETTEPVDAGGIVLEPGETIRGTVVNRDGAPIEGVEIRVEAAGGGGVMVILGAGMAADDEEPDALTDGSGWFELVDLSPKKRYTVSARRVGYLQASAGPFPLPHVEPVGLTLDPASDVRGRVVDGAGEAIAGAEVAMTRNRTIEMGSNVMRTIMMQSETTDGDGRFVFEDQEPGEMSIKAVASGYREAKLDGLSIAEGEDLEGVELTLAGGAVVTGQVLGPDGRPVIGAGVQPAGEGEAMMRMLEGSPSDGNGIYRLEGLAPGAVSIEATHDDWPRTVRDVELTAGVNHLDLQFEGGVEVEGRVSDTTGRGVAGAVVRLAPAGRGWGGPETIADGEGRYRMPGVQAGDYHVWAQAPGYASYTSETEIEVRGEPLYAVDIELDTGGAIVGRVSGVEPERFSDVGVEAQGPSARGAGAVAVDGDGRYRVDNLGPGSYTVVASVANSGKRASGEVTLEPGAVEATLDLEFAPGLTLSGRAVQAGSGIGGATVYVEGTNVVHDGWNETDHEGRFEIDGLEPGDYTIRLRHWKTGLAYDEPLSLSSDKTITLDVPTARVAGRVVDAGDREPLGGVTLALTADGSTSTGASAHSATTDVEGKFEFGNVADGAWTLSASK